MYRTNVGVIKKPHDNVRRSFQKLLLAYSSKTAGRRESLSRLILTLARFAKHAQLAKHSQRVGCLATLMLFGLFITQQSHVSAALTTYTIDTAQSQLAISGDLLQDNFFFNFQLAPQPGAPNSLVNSYQGTIVGDLAGSTLTFSGGSNIDALLHPEGEFIPAETTPGSEDNYGAIDNHPGDIGEAAIRNFRVDVVGGSASFGGPASGLQFTFAEGIFDFVENVFFNTGPMDLGAVSGSIANASGGNLEQTLVGSVETITIPIDITQVVTLINENDSTLNVLGQIVASRTISEPEGDPDPPSGVPEPNSFLLAVIAAMGWYLCGSRRRRR